MKIFGYFHKSRLLYGLPAFIVQKSKINRIDNVIVRNIKKLLNITTRTNSIKLKITLGLPDLNTYLVRRLIKLKIKYENAFNEKLNTVFYDVVRLLCRGLFVKILKKALFFLLCRRTLSWNIFS